MMTKEEASKELGISVRSLQRLTESGRLSKTLKRGASGKQEAFFDPEEIAGYKQERDSPTIKPALVTTSDIALARNDTHQFLEIFKGIVSPQKSVAVPVADKPLLKLDEASALTGLSRDILRGAIDTGELKAKIIGRAYRIKRPDLDAFIKKL